MEWPAALAEGDAVIVTVDTAGGRRFVMRTCRGPQIECRTYAEAEARALSYVEQAPAHVWYADGARLQLVGGRNRL